MKHIILAFLMIAGTFQFTSAQGNRHFRTPEERTNDAIAQLQPLKLDKATTEKATAIFSDFYTKQQNTFRQLRESGNTDRETLVSKVTELAKERDAKLKNIFNEDQYNQYMADIQPELNMRRQRNRNQ